MEFKYILIIFWIIFLLFCIYMIIKNENTSRQYDKIIYAIYKYNYECIENGDYENCINQNVKEHYGKTLFRLWDWGCENIVDKETYEKIKDYL